MIRGKMKGRKKINEYGNEEGRRRDDKEEKRGEERKGRENV